MPACETGPLRLVSPYLPGGMSSAVGEVLIRELPARLGLAVALDHVPGQAGARAASDVADANDPCLVLIGTVTTQVLLPAISRNVRYDGLQSFKPVALMGGAPLILAVRPGLPVRSVHDLIVLGRKHPLRYGTTGIGTVSHLAGAMFARLANLELEQVAADGSAAMTSDLEEGRADLAFDNAVVPLVRAGRLRALAVTSRSRLPGLPDVPTMSEAGVPGFDASPWVGLYASPAASAAFVDRLAGELARIERQPEVRKQLADLGVQSRFLGPTAFAEFTRAEIGRWGREVDLALGQVGRPGPARAPPAGTQAPPALPAPKP
ncbi:MAG TPA: tripartite tricarboxylate transporter substrate binding protein [Casimicrobiaceae bacterium]